MCLTPWPMTTYYVVGTVSALRTKVTYVFLVLKELSMK